MDSSKYILYTSADIEKELKDIQNSLHRLKQQRPSSARCNRFKLEFKYRINAMEAELASRKESKSSFREAETKTT